jgi:hypothetical protein
MAMNDDSLDQWVALYRQSAREQSAPSMDARILAAAEHAKRRRRTQALPLGLATAAALLLMLAMHLGTVRPSNESARVKPVPAEDDGTSAYLMQMDVVHASSPVAQYLNSGDPQDQ